MAQIILTQLQQALRAVMAAGSEAFGDGMEETGYGSRQLALLQSLSMMVGKMADGIEQDNALAHWTRQLLQMLEDNAPSAAGEVPTMLQFYKAVGEMQALLGVPEDRRAWNPEFAERCDLQEANPSRCDRLQEAAANRLESARVYARQARSLVPAFIDAAMQEADLSEADAICLRAVAQRLAATLEDAQDARAVNIYAEYIENANGLAEALTRQLGAAHSASDVLWALIRGIDTSLGDAELDMELETERAEQAEALATGGAALDKGDGGKEQDTPASGGISSDYSGSLADLPGMAGKRADVALGCAIEIEETASWLLAEMHRMPCDYERPFSRLLREIKRQAGLVMAACDDDEVTLAELQERAA